MTGPTPSTSVKRLPVSATVAAIWAVSVLSRRSASRISTTRSRASCLRAASTGPCGRTLVSSRDAAAAVRSVEPPPGSRSRSNACSWLTSLVRWVITLFRRSSSNANTVVRSSVTTRFASPCSAATLAAAAASMTSFFRRPPRDSSRTRAVAVEGTSSTISPRATSHCARCRPRPRAFSTAQRRSLNPPAHLNSRR